MKVCLVSPLPPPEGGIAVWSTVVKAHCSSMDGIKVFSVDTAVRLRSTYTDDMFSRIFGGSREAAATFIRVWRALVVERPDVVHLCSSGPFAPLRDILVLTLCKLNATPSVLHLHTGRLPSIISHRSWQWMLLRCAMLLSSSVVLLDSQSAGSLHKVLPKLIPKIIPNPIDQEIVDRVLAHRELGQTPRTKTQIFFVGHIIPTKGIRELVEACSLIDDGALEVNLVGRVEDWFRSELLKKAAQTGNPTWLKFHGLVDREKAMTYIRDADLFVLPSYTEGFPYVLVEAMMLGRPIIATAVGAIPEMLDSDTDRPCGIVVKPHDVLELKSAIVEVLQHPQAAAVLGSRAREKCLLTYSSDKVLPMYLNLWKSLTCSTV